MKFCNSYDQVVAIEGNGWRPMNDKYFWFWIVIIGILSFFTGEMVTFMMLLLLLLTLMEIKSVLKRFYEDWKRKN
ncbi:hypothetical protein [Halobacillus mangrovi]|uniref:hypothetical protein n=1 Tax=Halobacillus mangrovi TaxID=402384 RepID=UPI003D98F2EC